MIHALRVTLLIAVCGLALVACGREPNYADRTADLNKQYSFGQQSRKLMEERGVEVSDKACKNMWGSQGAADHHENSDEVEWRPYHDDEKGEGNEDGQTYGQLRQQYFVNGCMNRTRAGAAPTPSTSPAATTTP